MCQTHTELPRDEMMVFLIITACSQGNHKKADKIKLLIHDQKKKKYSPKVKERFQKSHM